MPQGTPVRLQVPAEGPLRDAIDAKISELQSAENKLAKSEKREPRTIELTEVIARAAYAGLGIEYIPPKRGRRWPRRGSLP